MQRDPMAGVDLTADPEQEYPSPAAKVARLARRRRPAEACLDLADDEDPSSMGDLTVYRNPQRDASTVSLIVRGWKVVDLSFEYDVQGPSSWVAPFCAIVLLGAIGAAVVMPNAILPPTASPTLWITVAAASGGAVMLAGAGAGVLFYWLRKKP